MKSSGKTINPEPENKVPRWEVCSADGAVMFRMIFPLQDDLNQKKGTVVALPIIGSPEEARGLARLLLAAADKAEEKTS